MAGLEEIKKLRDITKLGIMDCKQALREAEGDIEKAVEILRKKGLATLKKRADRRVSEGRIACKSSQDNKSVVMICLCCETDFVANSEDFIKAVSLLADYALVCPSPVDIKELLDTQLNGRRCSDVITELASKTGEKIEVSDFVRYTLQGPGVIGSYVHFNHKVASLIEVGCENDSLSRVKEVQSFADDLAMHIVASSPLYIASQDIPAEVLEKEKEIYRTQALESGKPENIVDRIVQGKLVRFFEETCLLEQAFIKDSSGKTKVRDYLKEVVFKARGSVSIRRFKRLEVGS